jgi:hypothetical protein
MGRAWSIDPVWFTAFLSGSISLASIHEAYDKADDRVYHSFEWSHISLCASSSHQEINR